MLLSEGAAVLRGAPHERGHANGGLSDVLLVNTKAMSGTGQLNANAAADDQDSKQVSNFVTAQSFSTFAVASVILKTIWELLQKLAGGWANSYWTPFVICLFYGLWQV